MENGRPDLVQAIKEKRWRELDLPPRQHALAEIAEKLSARPNRMTEADWQRLRDLGFDDEGLLEIAHVVGLFNYFTRLADGFGLVLDKQTEAASQTGVPLQSRGSQAAER